MSTVLYRIDESRNKRRFYRLDVQPDLFGHWLFVREWGRIGRRGQSRIMSFASGEEARAACERQHRARMRRGYAEAQGRSPSAAGGG